MLTYRKVRNICLFGKSREYRCTLEEKGEKLRGYKWENQ